MVSKAAAPVRLDVGRIKVPAARRERGKGDRSSWKLTGWAFGRLGPIECGYRQHQTRDYEQPSNGGLVDSKSPVTPTPRESRLCF